MAKSKAEIQKEYNEALKVSQSLTGALNKMIDNTEKSQKKVSDAQKEFNNRLKSINGSATDYESTQDAILALEKQKAGLSKRYFGANKKLLPQKQKEVQANIDILSSEAERVKLVNELDSNAHSLANSLNGSLDGLLSGLDEIPGIGKGLSKLASGPINNLKGAFSDSAKVFTTKFSSALANGKGGMAAFAKAGGASMKVLSGFLLSPVGAIAALTAVLAIGLKAFVEMEKGAKAFRDETGLLNSQMDGMDTTINSVYMETVGLGASMEDVGKNAAAFVKEFGGIEKPSENVIKSLTVMNKNFGVAVGDAAKVNKAFQNMGGLSADVAQANAESVVSLAQQNGVAPSKVMADIADSAEEAQGFFRGNIQALGAAAINAAKMGSSLKEAAKVSRGLLNYQDSVSNEMEASAILGTNLNFSQSRYLAATGDVVGAQAEMVKQLKNKVNLETASVFEIEAMEKATGMQFSQIQNMARLQELNLGLDKEQNALLQEAIKGGLDIKNMSADEIKAKTQALALQQETQGELESMGNALGAMGSQILQMFLPIGKIVMAMLKPVMSIIGGLMGTIGNSISSLMGAFSEIGDIFNEIFPPDKNGVGALAKVFEVIGSILGGVISFGINLFANGIKMVSSLISGVYDIFKGLMSGDFSQVADGLLSIGESILRFFQAIPMALFDTIVDIFPSVGTYFTGLWTRIKEMAAGIGPGIWESIKGAFTQAYNFIGSVFSKLADMVMAPWKPLIALFKGDIGLGDALMGIGTALLDNILAIPMALWDGITSIFGGFGTYLSDMMGAALDGLTSFLPSWLGGEETEVDDAVIGPNGDVISTSPEDYLIATKDPSSLFGDSAAGQMMGMTPLGAAANAVSGIDFSGIGASIGGLFGGGEETVGMDAVVAELKELKAAFVANKDVYIDNEKITSRVSKTQEKSNTNQFGIMGA